MSIVTVSKLRKPGPASELGGLEARGRWRVGPADLLLLGAIGLWAEALSRVRVGGMGSYGLVSVLPLTYFVELMRAIVLRGATLMEFWRHFLILAAMGFTFFTLCALRFQRKLT